MTRERTVGCLFDGIHGFGLGLAAAGPFRCAWTVENADYPRDVLKLRVPGADHLADVRDVRNPPRVDWLTGGFPCQDLSYAGLGAGISGSRSGLWTEYARIIGEVEPEIVLIENVTALLARGMDLVIENLVELGYRVEWDCLPAAAFGAPHLRDRVWIVAHRDSAPLVFGDPIALMARDVGVRRGDWRRWPRAGWVDGNPDEVLELAPHAPLADVKRGRVLMPTPAASNPNETEPLAAWEERRERERAKGRNGNGFGMPLGVYARKHPLPTPTTSNRKSARAMRSSTDDRRRSGGGQSSPPGLEQVAEMLDGAIPRELEGIDPAGLPAATRALWPTPNARDGGGGSSDAAKRREDGRQVDLRDRVREVEGLADPATYQAARERGESAALNPAWVEWLMGFPLGWTDLSVDVADLVVAPWEHGEPPNVPRITPREPRRRERLTALGNALVPAAPAWIAARIIENTTKGEHP